MNSKLCMSFSALSLVRKTLFPFCRTSSQAYRICKNIEGTKCYISSSAWQCPGRQVFNTLRLRQDVQGSDALLKVVKVLYCTEKIVPSDKKLSGGVPSDKKLSGGLKTENEPEKKMSIFQKFKAMYRDYWYVLVPVHLATSAVWFGSFYYMAKSGVDIAALAEVIHLSDETVEKIRANSNSLAGHLAVSYLLYKIFTPLRYTVTVGGTTVSINYLKKWGYIKPMPKRAELKKMLEEKRISFRKKRDNFRVRKDLMKRNVMEKLTQKKRAKRTADYIRKILQNRRVTKNG